MKSKSIFEQKIEFKNMYFEGIYFSTELALKTILKFDNKEILRIKREKKLRRILNK